MACMASITYTPLPKAKQLRARSSKRTKKKLGVKNMFWSQEMLNTFKKTWEEVAAEQVAKDPMFKKVYDDLMSFRSEYKYWQSKGFLPRNCGK
jgi:TRAP-type mannitol/chloroaromatic compound transport system substrate-binding protein